MNIQKDGVYVFSRILALVAFVLLANAYTGRAQQDDGAQGPDKSVGEKASDVVNGMKDRLGIGKPSNPASIYGIVEAIDAASGSFRISGVSGEFSAPSDVDITAFDGAEAKVEVNAGGDVTRITQPDPEAPETPEKGLLGEIKDLVGMPGTTVIDGVLMTSASDGRTFQINGLETTFITPEDANIENLDGHKVRVEVDARGQVESVDRHLGQDAEVGHDESATDF